MSDESQRQIFIQNIPYDVRESDLAHWCMGFGPITKCSLKCDKEGNSRGFAFVTYATMKGPDNICKINRFDDGNIWERTLRNDER